MKKRNYFLVVAMILFIGVGVLHMKQEFAAPENTAMRQAREYTAQVRQKQKACKRAKRYVASLERDLHNKYLDAETITPRDLRGLRWAKESVGPSCRR